MTRFSTDLTWNIGVCESGSKQSPINLTAAGATVADYSDLNWNLGYKIVQEGTLGFINDGKGSTYSSTSPLASLTDLQNNHVLLKIK